MENNTMNAKDVMKRLSDNFIQMQEGKVEVNLGKALANTASKMLSTATAQHRYNQSMGYRKEIPFFEDK